MILDSSIWVFGTFIFKSFKYSLTSLSESIIKSILSFFLYPSLVFSCSKVYLPYGNSNDAFPLLSVVIVFINFLLLS